MHTKFLRIISKKMQQHDWNSRVCQTHRLCTNHSETKKNFTDRIWWKNQERQQKMTLYQQWYSIQCNVNDLKNEFIHSVIEMNSSLNEAVFSLITIDCGQLWSCCSTYRSHQIHRNSQAAFRWIRKRTRQSWSCRYQEWFWLCSRFQQRGFLRGCYWKISETSYRL